MLPRYLSPCVFCRITQADDAQTKRLPLRKVQALVDLVPTLAVNVSQHVW